MTPDEPHNEPRPTPRPGPRPGPKPTPRPNPHPVASAPASDPHRFGRVDDDGTVWLISAAGERTIGSWQAGDTQAAFAHFGRRFEDLSTEITLLEERLAAGTGDARKIKATAAGLAETLPSAHVLGDVDALAARLAGIAEHAEATAAADRARRDEHRAAQTARKEALAVEAEDVANTSARETFNRRRGSHFAELDRDRAGAREVKEKLCVKAEELVDSTDWGATGAEFRKLLVDWKAAGRAARDVDDALWHRFKGAQDTFFKARNAATSERDAEFVANATAKEALLSEAEKLDTSNHEAARSALRSIAEKWDAIGKVPRERSADLERRLRAVEKKVRDAAEPSGPDPQAQARAEQFRERAEQFERQAQKAEAAGRAKEAEEAKANAEQWRQWAEAAADALTRKR